MGCLFHILIGPAHFAAAASNSSDSTSRSSCCTDFWASFGWCLQTGDDKWVKKEFSLEMHMNKMQFFVLLIWILVDAAANGAKTKGGLRSSRMSPEEAAQILNIKLPAKAEEITEVWLAVMLFANQGWAYFFLSSWTFWELLVVDEIFYWSTKK